MSPPAFSPLPHEPPVPDPPALTRSAAADKRLGYSGAAELLRRRMLSDAWALAPASRELSQATVGSVSRSWR
jgi:hypothetical protein